MEPRKRLKNGDKKSSKKTNNALKIGFYLRAVTLAPQWFIDHPRFSLLASLRYDFARRSNHELSLFFKKDASLYVRDFLNATIRGNEKVALKMLADNPGLLLERGHVVKGTTTDYSGRKYSGLTAFQIALCAGDEVMAMKMKVIFLKAYPKTGQAELDRQFIEIFPEGYDAHLEAQRASANQFERDIIGPLIKLFDGIDLGTGKANEHIIDDLKAALNKENNGSALCQALDQFREAFTALAQSEVVFNPNHLLKVLEKYQAKWHANENNPHRWLRLDLIWRQLIGFMQRFLPANYGQAFCTGFHNMVENKEPLERRLDLHNDINNRKINLFPLDADSSCRLGFDFAVYLGRRGLEHNRGWVGGCRAVGGLSYFKTFVEQKQQSCQSMQPMSHHNQVRRCLIQ